MARTLHITLPAGSRPLVTGIVGCPPEMRPSPRSALAKQDLQPLLAGGASGRLTQHSSQSSFV